MKINFKTALLSAVFVSASLITVAQVGKTSSIATTDDGAAVMRSEYTALVGNPYFNEDWVDGDVKLKDGSVQSGTPMKYDELQDNVYTKIGDDPAKFKKPVVEFTITDRSGKPAHFSVFPGNDKFSDIAYFQVLADGKVKLLRKNAKAVSESKDGIGTAVVTRLVVDNIDYYLLIDGKAVKIKKDKKSVEAALANKQSELDNYIKANNLNLKKDDDLAKLITQYNAL